MKRILLLALAVAGCERPPAPVPPPPPSAPEAGKPAEVSEGSEPREDLEAAADRQREEMRRTAREREREGNWAAAIELWERLALHDGSEAPAEVARLKEARAEEARGRALGPLLVELELLLRERRLEEARRFLEEAGRKEPGLEAEVSWLTGTVLEAEGLFRAVEAGARLRKGAEVELAGGRARIADADPVEVRFEGADAVRLEDLPPALLIELASAGGVTPDFTGQYLLFTGRVEEGRRAWQNVAHREALDKLADSVVKAKAAAKR